MPNQTASPKSSAVVIGAGVSGVVCANKLATAGFDVTLVELNNAIGVLAQGFERKVRLKNGETVRITFDLTHVVSEFLPGVHFHDLYTRLGVNWHRVGPFIPTRKIARLMTPTGEYYELLNGFEESRAQLKQLYPDESGSIDRYFRMLDRIDEQFKFPRHRSPGWQKSLETILEPLFKKARTALCIDVPAHPTRTGEMAYTYTAGAG